MPLVSDSGTTDWNNTITTGTYTGITDTVTFDTCIWTNVGIQSGTVSYYNPSGVEVKMVFDKTPKGIHPTLYFKYVKSKFTKMELDKIKRRVAKLRKMVVSAKAMNQYALMEQFSLMLAIAVRESEAVACGYNIWIKKARVDKFLHQVRDFQVSYCALEDFPRLVPEKHQKTVNLAKKKGLFDKYWVLYMDPLKEKLKTTKEKIKEKDPIVFGTFDFNPDVLYHICDWVDEHCDLTLEKFVDTIREDCPEFNLFSVPDLTDAEVRNLAEQVKIRHDRLKDTNSRNYQKKMAEEDRDQKGKKETITERVKRNAKKFLGDN